MASFKRGELRDILGEAYTDEIADKLVALHRGVVDPLKDDLDAAKRDATRYKADAEKLPGVQNELNELKGTDWKGKYESEHQSFEDYKGQVARDAEAVKAKAAHRKLLIDEGISEKAVDSILNATDYSKVKLGTDGALDKESAESLKKDITDRWSGFRVATRRRGENVATPPAGDGKMTREEIMKIKDPTERQAAIAHNLEVFQKG